MVLKNRKLYRRAAGRTSASEAGCRGEADCCSEIRCLSAASTATGFHGCGDSGEARVAALSVAQQREAGLALTLAMRQHATAAMPTPSINHVWGSGTGNGASANDQVQPAAAYAGSRTTVRGSLSVAVAKTEVPVNAVTWTSSWQQRTRTDGVVTSMT